MARRRMFSLDIVDTDAFLDLPSSSQALYFHLGMRADDDGFVSSPKRITATVSASPDDLKLLAAKGFIIPFASGVCVIRDWHINNYLRPDRYTPTLYQAEKQQLNASQDAGIPIGIPIDIPAVDSGKASISEVNMATKPPYTRFVPPTVDDVAAYCHERKNGIDPQHFVDFYTANGWTQGRGKPLKDWKACVRTWENRNAQSQSKDIPFTLKQNALADADLVEDPPGSGRYRPR